MEPSAPQRACVNMRVAPHNEFSKCLEYIETVPRSVAEDHCAALRGAFLESGACTNFNLVAQCGVTEIKLLSGDVVDVRYVASFYSGQCAVDFLTDEHCGTDPETIECEQEDLPPVPSPDPLPGGTGSP